MQLSFYPPKVYDDMWNRLWPCHIVPRTDLLRHEIKVIERQFVKDFTKIILQPKAGFFVVPSGIESFIGRTFRSSDVSSRDVILIQTTGRTLKIFHEVKNGEKVSIETSGLEFLDCSPIIAAEVKSTEDYDGNHADWPDHPCSGHPYDWTDITLTTAKGTALIRFLIDGSVSPGYDRRIDLIMF